MKLLVNERFRPVMDPGINQADMAMRTRESPTRGGSMSRAALLVLADLSEVVPAVTCGQVTIFRQQPEGIDSEKRLARLLLFHAALFDCSSSPCALPDQLSAWCTTRINGRTKRSR
jgi:hypothetical protein